jgi:hypothetical protein
MSTIEDKVRQIVVSTCKSELHNWQNKWAMDSRLQALEEIQEHLERDMGELFPRIEKLEARPERDECGTVDGNWVCCCGDSLEERRPSATAQAEDVEELRADIRTMYARLDAHRHKIRDIESALAMLLGEPAPSVVTYTTTGDEPKPNTEPSELVKLVRDRSHDPMFRELYGKGELCGPDWRGTNHYARLAILAVADWLERFEYPLICDYRTTAKCLRSQLEP